MQAPITDRATWIPLYKASSPTRDLASLVTQSGAHPSDFGSIPTACSTVTKEVSRVIVRNVDHVVQAQLYHRPRGLGAYGDELQSLRLIHMALTYISTVWNVFLSPISSFFTTDIPDQYVIPSHRRRYPCTSTHPRHTSQHDQRVIQTG
jgi:hypothetical protein